MALKVRARTPECAEVLFRKIATIREHGVDDRRAVAFRQDEAVTSRPAWVLWVVPHQMVVEGDDDVSRAKAAANMAGVCLVDHRDDVATDLPRLVLETLKFVSDKRISLHERNSTLKLKATGRGR